MEATILRQNGWEVTLRFDTYMTGLCCGGAISWTTGDGASGEIGDGVMEGSYMGDDSGSGSLTDGRYFSWVRTLGEGGNPVHVDVTYSYFQDGTYTIFISDCCPQTDFYYTFTVATAPDAPQNLTGGAGAAPNTIDLSWSAPADPLGRTLAGYNILMGFQAGNEQPYASVGPDTTTFTDAGIPSGQFRAYRVTANYTDGNESGLSNGLHAVAYGAPAISSFDPVRGGPGTTVNVYGEGFTASDTLFCGESYGSHVVSDGHVQVIVANWLPPGPCTIEVTNRYGTATAVQSFDFNYPPNLTSLQPMEGPSGITVDVYGDGLDNATALYFSYYSVEFTLVDATHITFTVPDVANGYWDVFVDSDYGYSNSLSFRLVTGATISSYSPPSGPAGTTVHVSGQGLSTISELVFDGAWIPFYEYSDSSGYFVVPDSAAPGNHTFQFLSSYGDSDVYTFQVPTPPANDDFENATWITSIPFTTTADTSVATRQPNEPQPCAGIGRTVWYAWTAPAAGWVTLETASSTYDPAIAAYTGSSLEDLVTVGCDDDSGPGLESRLDFEVAAFQTYWLQVGGYSSRSGVLQVTFHDGTCAEGVCTSPETGVVGAFMSALYAYGPTGYDSATFGLSSNGTAGYDRGLDYAEPPRPPGHMWNRAFFEDAHAATYLRELDTSILGLDGREWNLTVESYHFYEDDSGAATAYWMTLYWDPAAFSGFSPDVAVYLGDGSHTVNMRTTSYFQYLVSSPSGFEAHEMTIRIVDDVYHGLALAPLSATTATLNPGEMTTYAVQVTNTGTVPDTVHLSLMGYSACWCFDYSLSHDTLTLASGEMETVFIHVWAPTDARAMNRSINLTLEAASAGSMVTASLFTQTVVATGIDLELWAGWNLVSIPLDAVNASAVAIFGDAIVYEWDGVTYVEATTIVPGKGYWVLSEVSHTLRVMGAVRESLSLADLAVGWNLIGGAAGWSTVEPTGDIEDLMWSWTGSSFAASGLTSWNGRGYWIFVLSTPAAIEVRTYA